MSNALKAARLRLKWSQSKVADLVGVSRQGVGQWESGETEPSTDNLIRVCQVLGISLAEATGGRVIEGTDTDEAGEDFPFVEDRRSWLREPERDAGAAENVRLGKIPIYGIAAAGEDADFYANGDIIDFVRRPDGLTSARSVYAIHVVGESMYPRYEEGDLIFVNPLRTPVPGDYVVIEMKPDAGERTGKGFLKRLSRRGTDKIICEQFNPPKSLEFQADMVRSVHRVIPWNEMIVP